MDPLGRRNAPAHARFVAHLGLVAVFALRAVAAEPTATLAQADEAFEADEHDRALALYEQVLAGDPDQPQALMRTGLLLSWRREYDTSIERYDRLLALDPDRRDAAIERAKVLSWDHQFGEAERAFRAALERWPDDPEARIGLARTLSWRGDQAEARAVYAEILADDPHNVAALTGTAQTWAWSGRLAEARDAYGRALAESPSDRDARLGLAYVHLWSGDLAQADLLTTELLRDYPDDPEVALLSERTTGGLSPWVRTSVDHIEDTDENELNIYAASAGVPVHPRVEIVGGVAVYDMSDLTGDARIDSASAGVDLRPATGHLVGLRIGSDRIESTTGEETSETTGSVSWSFGLDRVWRGSVSAARETLRYSPTIADNDIVVDGLRAEGSGRVGDVWRVFGGAGFADFSDGNRRERIDLGFARSLRASGPHVEAGIELAGMNYEEDLSNGYFDPSNFSSALLVGRVSDTFGRREANWSAEASWGVQSFTADGTEVDNDEVFLLAGTIGWPIGRALRLELYGMRGDYAAATPSGFESWQVGARLRIAVF